MAPIGTVEVAEWFASPPATGFALVAFFVLGIVLVALCMGRKKPANAYDMNDAKGDGEGANGDTTTKTRGASDLDYSWRSHEDMPASTLQRTRVSTQ